MTDIIERLREDQNEHPEDDTWIEALFREAAAEIERLRLQVADYKAAYGGAAVTRQK